MDYKDYGVGIPNFEELESIIDGFGEYVATTYEVEIHLDMIFDEFTEILHLYFFIWDTHSTPILINVGKDWQSHYMNALHVHELPVITVCICFSDSEVGVDAFMKKEEKKYLGDFTTSS